MGIDAILLLTIGFGFYKGYETGLLRTLLMLLTVVVSFLLAFLVVFGLGYMVFRWIAEGIYHWIGHTPLSLANKILGGALYAYIYLLVIASILWLLLDYRLLQNQWIQHSHLYPIAEAQRTSFVKRVQDLQPYFQEFFQRIQSDLPIHPSQKDAH